MKKNILFLDGVPDKNQVYMGSVNLDGSFGIQTSGSCNIHSCISSNEDFELHHLILDTNNNQQVYIQKIDAIFNQISDADTHKITLDKIENITNQVGDKIPILNGAKSIKKCLRDNIYNILQNIQKVYIPKTVKIQPKNPQDVYEAIKENQLQFPIIFRVAGSHGGVSTAIISSFENDEIFYPFALDGREYYITQYVDYQKNNIYKKYRLVVVNGEVFIRHVLFSDFWMVHAQAREFMKKNSSYQEKEIHIINSFESKIKPNIQTQIKKITSCLNLEFFGLDCYIDDDFNLLVFEINPNMNILIPNKNDNNPKSIWNLQIQKIKDAIFSMFSERLQ